MSDPKGFLRYRRATPPYRPAPERVFDHRDVVLETAFSPEQTREQATRCMGCGVPFCHDGCPLGNLIPDFNAAVYREDWALAYQLLAHTNNFPEFTGRICPAPCEHACVLGINQDAVAIEHVEKTIVETAFARGWVQARPPAQRSGRKVAVIGSGPAGMAAAAELNARGHAVTVFEKDSRPGGLLRYGIPDFKLEKWVIDRRIEVLEAEGIAFRCGVEVGVDLSVEALERDFDAVLLCVGAARPRSLNIPNHELPGVHFAMDYLSQNNRRVAGEPFVTAGISASGRHVVVIGGGDTGSDCVGTANRQGARSVTQLQYRPRPSDTRSDSDPWPLMPMTLSTSSSHEEGCERAWEVQTKAFVAGPDGRVKGLLVAELIWEKDPATGRFGFQEQPGSEREIACDLALVAIGYRGVAQAPLWAQLGLDLNADGLLAAEGYRTSRGHIFAAGDARRGQSLVVWAIAEGRQAAEAVHVYLRAV
ncbi:MAG: glutamate synthase subunit beta [Saprospiraceae bacterium]|nr:glutamate synthase subunit beta [Saprospiraceae bacterium]